MEIYKLKHKPTGLYYQPVRGSYWQKTNLSKKGKIYQNGANALIGNGDTINIAISEKQYKGNKELFDSLGVTTYGSEFNLRCLKSDFEKEYITNNED